MEHFIPFRRTDIIHMCAGEGRLDATQQKRFRDYAEILTALFHFEFHARLERMKDAYAPFNPDRDTLRVRQWSTDDLTNKGTHFVDDLQSVIEDANFTRIDEADLALALDAESLFKVRLHVDFNDFEEVLFFRRGESLRRETVSSFLGFWRREIEFINYDRVVIYVRFRDAGHFAGQKRQLSFKPGSVMLKLFQNVPQADLENAVSQHRGADENH